MNSTPENFVGWTWESVEGKPGVKRGRFHADASLPTAEAVVRAIPIGGSLQFFDLYYCGPPRPDQGDPGAIFCVYRAKEDVWYVTCGNHGWHAQWHAASPAAIAAFMFGCRSSNEGPGPGSDYVYAYRRAHYRPTRDAIDPAENLLRRWDERR